MQSKTTMHKFTPHSRTRRVPRDIHLSASANAQRCKVSIQGEKHIQNCRAEFRRVFSVLKPLHTLFFFVCNVEFMGTGALWLDSMTQQVGADIHLQIFINRHASMSPSPPHFQRTIDQQAQHAETSALGDVSVSPSAATPNGMQGTT